MHKGFLKTGIFFSALAVIFGAFAAHAIKSRVTIDTLAIFETGVRYQMYHSFALLVTGILYKDFHNNSLIWAGRLFFAGIVFFSVSLYLLTYFKALENANMYWLGAITPIGGVCFILGWVWLFKGILQKNIEKLTS